MEAKCDESAGWRDREISRRVARAQDQSRVPDGSSLQQVG